MAQQKKDLWGEADNLVKQANKVAEAKYTAATLPYQLKDEFRKAQDPELDNKINEAQQVMFGGFDAGLNKYQNITNPFARRDLASRYQGGLSADYANLTDERTRRQGVYNDYIAKWSGLYGAEASRQQDIYTNKVDQFNRDKSLADTEENTRRWNIENAQSVSKANKKDSSDFWRYAQSELSKSVGEDTLYDPGVYERVRSEALSEFGITKQQFDNEMGNKVNSSDHSRLGIKLGDPSTVNNDEKAQIEMDRRRKLSEFTSQVKSSEDEAKYGEYYWKDGEIYKKTRGFFSDEKIDKEAIIR